ncbi:acyl-CoA dehydrogenase family protein [Nocardia sp. NPDC059239]|uniref:acyl-CoA dehydrogenase family protein n=1 Tax=Nocardia sp. NPDC059239 TaxID=3346785 RepID=UPI0036942422
MEYARAALEHDIPFPKSEAWASLGAMELLADESRGGGGTVLDLTVVAEQAGKHLTPARLVSFAGRAVTLLEMLGSPEALALLDAGLTGERNVVVADCTRHPAEQFRLDQAGAVHGRTAPVLDGVAATDVILLAETEAGPVVVAVDLTGSSTAVRRIGPKPLDATRGLEVFELSGAPARILSAEAPVQPAWDRAKNIAVVLLAAEDLGAATQANQLARAYALTRHTFNRPIGSFQAVKHALVDAYVGEEQLRSLVWLAAWSADAQPENLGLYAAAAGAYAADVLNRSAQTLIHTHGGVGFTWEHDAHLYWRRAQVDKELLGTAGSHRRTVAALNLDLDLEPVP